MSDENNRQPPPPNILTFPGVELPPPTAAEIDQEKVKNEVLERAALHEHFIVIGIDGGRVSGIGITLPIGTGRQALGYMYEAASTFLQVLRYGR